MEESRQLRENTRAWPAGIAAITLFVEDLEEAKRFYSDVFQLPVFFEDDNSTVFKFGETLLNPARGERSAGAGRACAGCGPRLAHELEGAGVAEPVVRVVPVAEIEREAGHAAKLKLVTSAR
jgi:catechol 2,3-dioxygenase-like lactoylglutathione lyase family enzyme